MVDAALGRPHASTASEAASDIDGSAELRSFLFEHMLDGVAYLRLDEDEQGRTDWVYVEVNPAFYRLTGLADVIGKRPSQAVPGLRDSNPEVFDTYARIAKTGVPEEFSVYIVPLDTWMHIHASSPAPGHILAVLEDITARMESQQALAKTTRRLEAANARLDRTARGLRLLTLSDQALVRAADEDSLLQDVCDLIVHAGGYAMAWVGLAANDRAKSVDIAARAGDEECLELLGKVSWEAGIAGKSPMGTCIRSGRIIDIHNIKTWKTRAGWKREALARGYRASLDVPIRADGVVVGGLELWACEVNAFDANERALFEELADNLGFGLASLRAHRTTKDASESLGIATMRLEQMVMDVTEAFGKVVEVRDPYTQGHQVRVAGLAKMLAKEMALSGDDVLSIEVAGLVHDVGNMRVPVEILAKPGILDAEEFSVVQQHSRAGFEILKDITFPWPVAETVLQHHERMDGSGYPDGLSGDAIGMQARFLAVADVVEALSSHRPHRPAISLDAAIAHVREAREEFDPAIVAACVRLHEQGRIDL